jgi:hypothetical protein
MNKYVEAVNRLKADLNRLHDSKSLSWGEIVKRPKYSCVSKATAWRIATTGYMPTGQTRILLNLPPSRVRISADVTEPQRQALHDWSAQWNMSWSEFCREMADSVMDCDFNNDYLEGEK